MTEVVVKEIDNEEPKEETIPEPIQEEAPKEEEKPEEIIETPVQENPQPATVVPKPKRLRGGIKVSPVVGIKDDFLVFLHLLHNFIFNFNNLLNQHIHTILPSVKERL